MPGNAGEWIALAYSTYANASYLASLQTNGNTSGTATFTAPASGPTFVVRAFSSSNTPLAQTPFFNVHN